MKNSMIILAILVSAVIFPGQGAVAAAKSDAVDTPLDKVDEFIQKGFEFKFGHTKSKIIKNLGDPLLTHCERVKSANPYAANPADEINDEICDLVYEGLIVVLYLAAAEHQELIQRVLITSPRFPLKGGLKIGSSRDDVIKLLGVPSQEQSDNIRYHNRTGTESSVSFFFNNNAVSKIEWSYSVIE